MNTDQWLNWVHVPFSPFSHWSAKLKAAYIFLFTTTYLRHILQKEVLLCLLSVWWRGLLCYLLTFFVWTVFWALGIYPACKQEWLWVWPCKTRVFIACICSKPPFACQSSFVNHVKMKVDLTLHKYGFFNKIFYFARQQSQERKWQSIQEINHNIDLHIIFRVKCFSKDNTAPLLL